MLPSAAAELLIPPPAAPPVLLFIFGKGKRIVPAFITGREGGADVLGHPRANDAAVAELKEPRLRCCDDRRLVVVVAPSADDEEDEEEAE